MKKKISEISILELSNDDLNDFITKYLELVTSSTDIIRIIETDSTLKLVVDDSNHAID